MARFRASILRTNETRVSRQDQVSIETHTCGERVGIRVHAYVHPETGKDVLVVFLTGGRQDPTGKRVGVYVEGVPCTVERDESFSDPGIDYESPYQDLQDRRRMDDWFA